MSDNRIKQNPYVCINDVTPYKCRKCPNFKTYKKILLKLHIKNGHSVETPDETNFKCLICNFKTYSKYLILRHMFFDKCQAIKLAKTSSNEIDGLNSGLQEDGWYKCVDRFHKNHTYKTRDKESFDTHMIMGHVRVSGTNSLFHCPVCPSKFTFKSALRNHVKFKHVVPEGKYRFECRLCKYKTQSGYLLIRHTFAKHVSAGKHPCQHCSRIFRLESRLKSHLNHCHNSKKFGPIRCEKCQSEFKEKIGLTRHLKLVHSKPDEIHWFQCGQCPKRFKRKQNLQAHVKFRHTAIEDTGFFECAECGFKFKAKSCLITHIKICHPKPRDVQWFQCEQCPSKFGQKIYLRKHVQTCHANPEEIHWFECEQCPSKLKTKRDLNNHIISFHTKSKDIRWIKCDHCPLKFKHSYILKKHIKARHTKPEDVQWFECGQCTSKFKRSDALKNHIRLIHLSPDEVQWFECGHCSRKFKAKANLKKHIQGRHLKSVKFQCEHCPYQAGRRNDLTNHVLRRHADPEGIQWLGCEHCSFKAKTEKGLDAHLKVWREGKSNGTRRRRLAKK